MTLYEERMRVAHKIELSNRINGIETSDRVALRQAYKIELARKLDDADVLDDGSDDVIEAELGDDVPTEEDFLRRAEAMTRPEIIEALRLIKDLIEDPDEDVDYADQVFLRDAFVQTVKALEESPDFSTAHLGFPKALEAFYNKNVVEFHSGHPDQRVHNPTKSSGSRTSVSRPKVLKDGPDQGGSTLRRRLRSLTPKGLRSSWYKKGSAFQNEFNHGKYNWKYRPRNIKEAKRKRVKTRNSRLRWTAAALITMPLMVVGPYRRKMLGILKTKREHHFTAKRQHRSFMSV